MTRAALTATRNRYLRRLCRVHLRRAFELLVGMDVANDAGAPWEPAA